MTPTPQQLAALRAICEAIIDAVAAAGTHGAPAGVLYAALMAYGFTLEKFQNYMGALVSAGKLRQEGNLYFTA